MKVNFSPAISIVVVSYKAASYFISTRLIFIIALVDPSWIAAASVKIFIVEPGSNAYEMTSLL